VRVACALAISVGALAVVVAGCDSGGVAGPGLDAPAGPAGSDGAAEAASHDAASGGASDGSDDLAAEQLAADTSGTDANLEAGSSDRAPDAPAVDAGGDRADTPPGGDAAEAPTDTATERVSMPCVAPGVCDPFDPSSCGAKICVVQGDGNTACVAGAATLKASGASCASRLECAGGLDCVRIGDDPGTTCQRMCPHGSIGFCGGESRCTDFIVGCSQYCRLRDVPCDIYAQNCGDLGRACALSVDSETGARYTGCRAAGTGARGDRCDTGVTCGKGLLCVRDSGVSTCRQICTGDGGALPCAGAGETCSGLTSTYQITYCQ
jgi:hypothetical protein